MEREEQQIGPVTVLYGAARGKYPEGNSLLVRGANETIMIDPSLGLLARKNDARLGHVDRVLHSHCHEDHTAGSHLFAEVPWHFHEADAPGIRSLDAMMEIFGYPDPIGGHFRDALVKDFHFHPRSDALDFRDGDVFDLGGGVTIRVIHTPGHTRGHSCLLVEWQGERRESLLYLGDIDLSSFGPYYGDAWSDLEDFERSLAMVKDIVVDHYATFHHIGVLSDRDLYLERLTRFIAVIADREARLLAYLEEPRSLAEIAEHRFVFRPGDKVAFATAVEQRSMGQHLARLMASGRVSESEGRFLRCD